MKVLILCTGNSCRSQMAHGFLKSFAPELSVFSARTIPAEKVNPQAVAVMKEVGIDISNTSSAHWFHDSSDAEGPKEHVMSEFRRVRDEIRYRFKLFNNEIHNGNN